MIAYKLVWRVGETRGKSISNDEYRIYYELGKKAVPKVGKILVFDSISNLLAFADCVWGGLDSSQLIIFCGEAENPKKMRKLCSSGGYIDIFWKKHKLKKGYFSGCAPKGTIACDSFLPKEIIKII